MSYLDSIEDKSFRLKAKVLTQHMEIKMNSSSDELLVIKLLEETTTLQVIRDFLKGKGLHHSASSWEQLRSERILPALRECKINNQDLINLLQSAEEYRLQHVFLFKCSNEEKLHTLLDRERIGKILTKMELGDILIKPKILDQPQLPTIVDVRLDKSGLIIKIIETRISEKLLKEVFNEDETVSRVYKKVSERAVNVVRLRTSGELELCLASQSGKSYQKNLNNIWSLVEEIIPAQDFSEVYLNRAKNLLWKNREDYAQNLLRFSSLGARNDKGTLLTIASGSRDTNLFKDNGANVSAESFVSHDGYCENYNFWLLQQENQGIPTEDIHVTISGELNEFSINPHSREENYEYAIKLLRQLNS